jgi:2-polyprenyl-3-methyl-5-hydroxy-6-metoxy-1,4-benzoquinol methylase
VTIRIGETEVARISAELPMDDLQAAGMSAMSRRGFEYIFQRPLSDEEVTRVSVVVGESGEPLERQSRAAVSLYPRLFSGSYAADNTLPEAAFLSAHYIRHNARRLEHLATLGLPLAGRSVVEFGAGVGDHTTFYLDRGCSVMSTDARPENLALLKERTRDHPQSSRLRVVVVNVDEPFNLRESFAVVHCYGLLYHLAKPGQALALMASHCSDLFLLETKADPRHGIEAMVGEEDRAEVYHSISGMNFRPSRGWLALELRRHFAHVYFPRTVPAHEEFPTDWSDISHVPDRWPRAIIVASRTPLDNPLLSDDPPSKMFPV